MRYLTLCRHAKASSGSFHEKDLTRPLSPQGRKVAENMAVRAARAGWTPDWILSSPASRASATAEFFRKAFCLPEGRLRLVAELYLASPQEIWDIVAGFFENAQDIFVVAHNPSMETLVSSLAQRLLPFPTSGLARFSCSAERWADAAIEDFALVHYEAPNDGKRME